MRDLIRSEWRRFRRIALIFALCHGLALLLLSRIVDVAQLGADDQAAMLVLYMLLGLTLALIQVGSYRQASRWLWLIHRPLPPARIFAALALAAAVQLSVAILIPLLVFLVATDALTTHVVDIRHYVSAVLAMAFTMMAWMAGAHASTSRYKAAIAVLLAPLMLALHLASVWSLLLPVFVCLGWLVLIAKHSFRADRDAPISRHGVLLLTALPLQLGFFLLVFHLSKTGLAVVELLGRSSPGRTVLTTDTDVDVDAMIRNMSQSFIAKGLEGSSDPRAATWREQLPLLRIAGLAPDIDRFPVRHQFGNLTPPWFDDERSIKWTFSHDQMVYQGRDPMSGAAAGTWGLAGAGAPDPYVAVPTQGMTRTTLYSMDRQAQRQYERIRLADGEWFVGSPVQDLDRILLLTNRRLLAYRPSRGGLDPFAPYELDWELPLDPDEMAPVGVNIAELLDGWLVSLYYYDDREFDGFESFLDPWQQVVHIDTDGRATVVGERLHIRGHGVSQRSSVLVPIASWWVSPPLYALAHLPDRFLDTGLTEPLRFEPFPKVPLFYPLALSLMVLSLAGGFIWLRGTPMRSSRRRLWLASCALLGVPGFLSLICLEPRRSRA